MLYNDHSSTELEQQLRIEELTRERDEARAEVKRFRDWYRNVFGGPSKRETPWPLPPLGIRALPMPEEP